MSIQDTTKNTIEVGDTKGMKPEAWLEANGFSPDDWEAVPATLGWWESRTREDEEPVVLERGGFKFQRKAEAIFDFTEMEAYRKAVARDVKSKYKHRGKTSIYSEGSGWGDQQLAKVDQRGGTETSLSNWHEAREARGDRWAKRKPVTSFHVNGGDLVEGFTGSAKSGLVDMGVYEALSLAFSERMDDIEQAWRLSAGDHFDITPAANHGDIRINGQRMGAVANDADLTVSRMCEKAFAARGIGPKQGLHFRRPADDFTDYVIVPELNLLAMHGDKARGPKGVEAWLAKQPKASKTTSVFTAHLHHAQMRSWGINPFSGAERSIIQLPALEPSSYWIEQLNGMAVSRPGLWLGALDADGALVPMEWGFVPVGAAPEASL